MRRVAAFVALAALVGGLSACATAVHGRGALPDPHDAVLQTKDLPDWDESASKDNSDPTFDAVFGRCFGPKASAAPLASADSPEFDKGEASISSSAAVMRSPAQVRSDVALLLDPKFAGCVQKAMAASVVKSLPAGATVDSLQFSVRKRVAGEPSTLAAFGRGTMAVSAAGQSVRAYFDMALMTGLRMEAFLGFFDLNTPFDAGLERNVESLVGGRLA